MTKTRVLFVELDGLEATSVLVNNPVHGFLARHVVFLTKNDRERHVHLLQVIDRSSERTIELSVFLMTVAVSLETASHGDLTIVVVALPTGVSGRLRQYGG
jgi:hypothetical protein